MPSRNCIRRSISLPSAVKIRLSLRSCIDDACRIKRRVPSPHRDVDAFAALSMLSVKLTSEMWVELWSATGRAAWKGGLIKGCFI
jgi:hypothetical protein